MAENNKFNPHRLDELILGEKNYTEAILELRKRIRRLEERVEQLEKRK